MGIRQLILALACGVGSASSRLDAAVLQAARADVNIDDALRTARFAAGGRDLPSARRHPLPQVRGGDTLLARAESLLATGNLAGARRIVERLQDRRPDDVVVLVLLGRIHLAWPVIGRFTAESLFARAVRLDPGNPEPLYYLGMVGIALGNDDGETIARRGFVPLLALQPGYRDTWFRWTTLYRGDSERAAALAALDRHAGEWDADYWRAQLLVEQRRYGEAEALLADVTARRPADPGPWAWLARARFTAGRDPSAAAAYDSALARADRDTGAVLWKQIRGIASATEREEWRTTLPTRRAAYLRRFWAFREPDVTTSLNERLGEHFRRMVEAQRVYGLRHPNSRYFRSPLFRALSGGVGGMPGGLEGAEQRAAEAQCSARMPSVRDAAPQSGVRQQVESARDSTLNLEDHLDDRGRVYLRHGPPDYRSIGSLADETWCYVRPDGSVLRVSFVRRTGGFGATGDMVVTPMVAGEAESAQELLATDRFSAPSTLSFAFWPAAFRASSRWQTELFLVPDSVGATAALVDDDGREVARDSATDRALRLVAPPGRYLLLVDAVRADHTGRYRGSITLPDFGEDEAAISSILVASGAAPAVLEGMVDRAPHALVLPAAAPLRIYAELYNMGRIDSTSRYIASYRFERTDGFILRSRRENATTISFERATPFAARIIETLVVDPGRLPPGRYRLHLEIRDEVRGAQTASSMIEFRLR